MNKQELIKHIEDLPYNEGLIVDTIKISRNGLLKLIEQLDELEKVKIPQFVADWLSNLKSGLFGLNYDSVPSEIYDWVYATEDNLRKLHLAFVYGYEVEKEKRYRISMPKARNYKNHAQFLCEKNSKMFWCAEWYSHKTKFTRKELEQAGFGWVFNCPGIEIEEVI
jgi:hypothetical protein